jgi:hypothetical protein
LTIPSSQTGLVQTSLEVEVRQPTFNLSCPDNWTEYAQDDVLDQVISQVLRHLVVDKFASLN